MNENIDSKKEDRNDYREYRDERRGSQRNLLNCFGLSCGTIFGLGCLTMIFLIVGFFYVIIARPNFIWERVVNYLNAGETIETINTDLTSNEVKENINAQITNNQGLNEVIITEEELNVLAREQFNELNNVNVNVEPQEMIVNWVIEESSGKPLYGEAIIKSEGEDNLFLDKIGTKRVYLPQGVNSLILDAAINGLNINRDGNDNLIYEILALNQEYKVEKITFAKDTLIITLNVSVNIFE